MPPPSIKPHVFNFELWIIFRYYARLPTESSHELHSEMMAELEALESAENSQPLPKSRLHPKVQTKIRDLVSGGETRLYAIRKVLRYGCLLMFRRLSFPVQFAFLSVCVN